MNFGGRKRKLKLTGARLKYLSGEYEELKTTEEVSLNMAGRCSCRLSVCKKI